MKEWMPNIKVSLSLIYLHTFLHLFTEAHWSTRAVTPTIFSYQSSRLSIVRFSESSINLCQQFIEQQPL